MFCIKNNMRVDPKNSNSSVAKTNIEIYMAKKEKKSRVKFNSFKRQLLLGGLAVPDILCYYSAIILAGFVKQYDNQYKADWNLVEQAYDTTQRFKEIWNKYKISQSKLKLNPFYHTFLVIK